MQGKFRVIALCGSEKFKSELDKSFQDLTLQGYIVIPFETFDSIHKSKINSYTSMILSEMRKSKIDMCDELFVINVNGEIDYQTKLEIQYAWRAGKIVKYYQPVSTDMESIIMNQTNKEEQDVLTTILENRKLDVNSKCLTCSKRYACSDHNILSCPESGGMNIEEFVAKARNN